MSTPDPTNNNQAIKQSIQKALKIGAVGAILMLAGVKLAPKEKPLAPAEYYAQGVQYKKRGRTELSREQLQKAIAAGDAVISQKALVFMSTQLPRHPISQDAEQRNAIGFNQLAKHDYVAARKTFEDLTRDFPDFEWPYFNLGTMCLREHKLEQAGTYLEKAVEINPNYLKAWAALARQKFMSGNDAGGNECLQRCRDLAAGQLIILKDPAP